MISLVAVRIAFKHLFTGDKTWADLFTFAVFFLIGYLIAADQRYTESIKRDAWVGLAMAIIGFGGFSFSFFPATPLVLNLFL